MKRADDIDDLFAPKRGEASQFINPSPPQMTPEYIETVRDYARGCKARLLRGFNRTMEGADADK